MDHKSTSTISSGRGDELVPVTFPFLSADRGVAETQPTRVKISFATRRGILSRWRVILDTPLLLRLREGEERTVYELVQARWNIPRVFAARPGLPVSLKLKRRSTTLRQLSLTSGQLLEGALMGFLHLYLRDETLLFHAESRVCVERLPSSTGQESSHPSDNDARPAPPLPPSSSPPSSDPRPKPSPSSPSSSMRLSTSSPSLPQTPNDRPSPIQVIDVTLPLQGASTPQRSSWKCPPLVPTLATLLLLGLAGCGLVYHRRGVLNGLPVDELPSESPEHDYFSAYNHGQLEDELEDYVHEEMNEKDKQDLPPLNDDDAQEGEEKGQVTDMDLLKRASCRTTVRGVHYSGKLSQVLHAEDVQCLPWSLFDVALFIKQTRWGDVSRWTDAKDKRSREYRPTRSQRRKLEKKWKEIFSEISSGSTRLCRNFGGLFTEPSCLINGTDAFKIDMKKIFSVIQGSYNRNKTVVAACGVPVCPDFFGPHAGQQCRVTQHGTEAAGGACLPFRDFTPPSPFHCNITEDVQGPTYTWTHPSEGYSLLIPTRARRCHDLRRAVLVKGGYEARVWFEIPVMKDYVSLRVHPYSDEQPVELILQYRYSADRADGGYNVGLTSRHFHVFHAQHLAHVSRGHAPILTDYLPLTVWKKVLNVTQDKTLQYAAKDVVEAMNAGKVTDVVFQKKGKKAQLSLQDGRHTIKLSSPDEADRFPRFVRLFSDGLAEVQMDAFCPVVHVHRSQRFINDFNDAVFRHKDRMTERARAVVGVHGNPVVYFRHRQEGVYFPLQRKRRSTHMILYHHYNGGGDGASVFFSTFPRLSDALLLSLQPPYKFQLLRGSPQPPMEWENRQAGPFEGQHLQIGWHGYSVTFTKTTFTLHHLGKKGAVILIYKANFLRYQPPVLYAFLSAGGGKFTVNCQPRYEEYMKTTPKASTQAKLTLAGTEYAGVRAVSRSGRLCLPSQHSPQALCRTWSIGKMLHHGPACRVLSGKDFQIKLKQLGINGTEDEASVIKERDHPASPFFGFGFESCGVRHKHENDPAFHYFSVSRATEIRRSSELLDLRTVTSGKLEFGFLSASNATDSVMSLLFLDTAGQKRMQIFLGVYKKYLTVRAFLKDRKDVVRSAKLSGIEVITETNYSHCELWMTSTLMDIQCWDFLKKQMAPLLPKINYRVIINDTSEGAVRYISLGTDVTVHEAVVRRSSGARTAWFDSPEGRPRQGVSVWRVRLPCPWFTLPPRTPSHLRPLRLNQDYFFQTDRNTSLVSLNFFNDIDPNEAYERPLEIRYTPGKAVQVKFVTKYRAETLEYDTNPLEYKFIFSVTKLDINMWLSVARQLCPETLHAVLIQRGAASRSSRPAEAITFVSRPGSRRVLWNEEGKRQTELELERVNLSLEWFPRHCWSTVAINTYVVALRDRFRKVKYIIEVDDNRGLDAATLEFFSVEMHNESAAFSVNTRSCEPLTREQIENYKESRLVLTSRGNCSQPCGTGYRLLEYRCKRPMNGALCKADHTGLQTGERLEALKVWATCHERECFRLKNYLRPINITNVTLAIGERVTLTCVDEAYSFALKKNMPADHRLEVLWFRDDAPHEHQRNSIVVSMAGPDDAGLYHCYIRHNGGLHYIVQTVGVIPDKNERYVMLLMNHELEMRAPKLLEALEHQVVASWYHRRTRDDEYEKIQTGFMGWVETLTLRQVKEQHLGEYLGCLKGFPHGANLTAAQDTQLADMACPFYAKLIKDSYRNRISPYIKMVVSLNAEEYVGWFVLVLLVMRLLEGLAKCLYIRRQTRKVDFWDKTRLRIKMLGETPLHRYEGSSRGEAGEGVLTGEKGE